MNPKLTAAFNTVHALRNLDDDPSVQLLKEQLLKEAWEGNSQVSLPVDQNGRVEIWSLTLGDEVQWSVEEVEAAAKVLDIPTERVAGRHGHLTLIFDAPAIPHPPAPPVVRAEAKLPSPQDFNKVVVQTLPARVIEIFTKLMVVNLGPSGAGRIYWANFDAALKEEFGTYPSYYSEAIVPALREAGWGAHLDQPGYNESYKPFYEISPRRLRVWGS
jgi:hypothetical protein